jgi:lantibiotic transport system permease protein
MGRVLAADWLKIRRTWVVWLTLLGPAAMVLCQAINYGIRPEYLIPRGWEGKQGMFFWVYLLLPLALMTGSMLTAAIAAGHEHDSDGWKQLLALPVPRFAWVVGKAVWLAILLVVAGLLTVAGIGMFGAAIGLPQPVPWLKLTRLIFWPVAATLPFLALQLWMSLILRNQAVPVMMGILGALAGPYMAFRQDIHLHWWIWAWPSNVHPRFPDASEWVWISLATTPVLIILAAVHFSRKEIH